MKALLCGIGVSKCESDDSLEEGDAAYQPSIGPPRRRVPYASNLMEDPSSNELHRACFSRSDRLTTLQNTSPNASHVRRRPQDPAPSPPIVHPGTGAAGSAVATDPFFDGRRDAECVMTCLMRPGNHSTLHRRVGLGLEHRFDVCQTQSPLHALPLSHCLCARFPWKWRWSGRGISPRRMFVCIFRRRRIPSAPL